MKPIGDRLSYDLVFDLEGILVRIQVKSAWPYKATGNFTVDNRRTKTNRRVMLRAPYVASDFDFALVYLQDRSVFYVLPVEVFVAYGSGINFVETEKRQRKPRSAEYRDRWELILQWAARQETGV